MRDPATSPLPPVLASGSGAPAAVVGLVAAVCALSFFAFDVSLAGSRTFAIAVAATNVVLAGIALFVAKREGVLEVWVRPVWGDISRGVASAVIFLFAAWLFVRFVTPPTSIRASWIARICLQFGNPSVLRAHLFWVAVYVIVVSACEEIVWRGLAMHLLETRYGTRAATLLSVLAFAAAQVPTAYALRDPEAGMNPLLPLAALFGGALWTKLSLRDGRLIPAILSHAMFAWCVLVTFRLWGPSV